MDKYICTSCQTRFDNPKKDNWIVSLLILSIIYIFMLVVSFLSGLAVLIVIIIPVSIGHIAYRIFGKRNARCPACNSKEFIPASTPKAKSIIKNKG